MALVPALTEPEVSLTSVADPYDWTLEQVVHCLCSSESPIVGSNVRLPLPDPDSFASALRKEWIDGEALLTLITKEMLHDAWGLAYGLCAKILNLIRKLQHQSFKFQQMRKEILANDQSLLESTVQISYRSTPCMRSSEDHDLAIKTPSSNQSFAYLQTRNTRGQRPVFPLVLSPAADTHQNVDSPPASHTEPVGLNDAGLVLPAIQTQTETTVIDDNGRKRRRLVLGPTNTEVAPGQAEVLAHAQLDTSQGLTQIDDSECRVPSSECQDRDLETNLPGGVFPDPTDSNETCSNALATSQAIYNHSTDNTIEASPAKRRRIQPTLVIQPHEGLTHHEMSTIAMRSRDSKVTTSGDENFQVLKQSPLGKRAKRSISQIHYGPSALHVDDIFYSDTVLGATLDDEVLDISADQQGLCFTSLGQKSDAERSWVNSRMKYFFQSTTTDLIVREGGQEVGIIPYPDRLGKRNEPLSMTLLSHHRHRILAKRINRSSWNTTNLPSTSITVTTPSDAFKVRDPLMAVDDDSRDWDSLWKWNHRDDNEVLPLYGDSGSEGDYDLETWREIENESGKIVRPVGRSNMPNLSLHEVEGVIDTVIKKLREKWHTKQETKVRHKAWRYWVKARRDHTTRVQIENLEKRSKELDTRILVLRKEICEEEWTKIDPILKQANIMQPSVFEQEECEWRIRILQSKQAPEKAVAHCKRPWMERTQNPSFQDREKDLSSNASTGADEETDDDLDDFIVSDDDAEMDDQIANRDEEATMADLEDAVESDTLNETSNDALPPSLEAKTPTKTIPRLGVHPQSGATATPCFIDLTQDSNSPSSPVMNPELGRIQTPPLINNDDDSDAWFQRSRGKRPKFKHPPSIETAPIINLDTDSDSRDSLKESIQLPSLDDVERIRTLDATKLVEKQDRKRLLTWLIAHTDDDKRRRIITYANSVDAKSCLIQVENALTKMKAGKHGLRGIKQETSDCILQIAAWDVGWTIPVKLDSKGISISHIRTTLENSEGFELFFDFMMKCLRYYKQELDQPLKRKPRTASKQNANSSLSDSSSSTANLRTMASESQQTLQKRDAALQRMREDNYRVQIRAQKKARQMELLARLSSTESQQAGRLEDSEVIVNPGKRDEKDFIRLNPRFGRGTHLKPHQKEGLQFMWREITGDHNDLQGCLLAQTMGLGKTAQVIALLIALSDAANSSINAIRDQIPVQLRNSQTLILCPAGLIENWWDECLLWPPDSNHLGEIRKVNAVMKLEERISEILGWSQEGGILLMGYSTFRDLLRNKTKVLKANRATATVVPALLTEEQHQHIRTALLEKPNIVVADEAHEFKSQSSNINQVINQISCKSRIALTGSPLSNNLGEYFSMIDWIAPGYLGTYNDFKSVYEHPIQDGLYQDTEPALYRESRKRLKALELELEPKIHRADVSALHNSLYGKSEFVIRVPLTAFQERLYRSFVSIISGDNGHIEGKVREAKLWSYLSRLQLLCNHPVLFYNKLVEEHSYLNGKSQPKMLQEAVQKRSDVFKVNKNSESVPHETLITHALIGPVVVSDEDASPLPDTVLSVALREIRQAISELDEDVSALYLSNKMQAIIRIIELSTMSGDKVLIFSHRLDTLDYIGNQLIDRSKCFCRIDGKTIPSKRQEITKSFNEGSFAICLISTRAGGQGLNMFGANRVVIVDSQFNPMWEQQAVGRAYRFGQNKHVYVYRLTVAGTFEEEMQDQGLFKQQLATRVLEKKNPDRIGLKGTKQYIFPPKQVEYGDVQAFLGKDTGVLDHLLTDQERTRIVSVTPSETFYVDDGHDLTAQERQEAEQLLKDEQLRRRNAGQYQAMLQKRLRLQTHSSIPLNQPSATRDPRLEAQPRAIGPQTHSTYHHYVKTWLTASVNALFSSGPLSPSKREHTSEALRRMVKASMLDLILPKDVPHPGSTTDKLCLLIGQNAKNEEDYSRLWEVIKTILEKPDGNPDTLLHIMVAKLGEPRQDESESGRKESDDMSIEATTSLQIEGTNHSAPSDGNPSGSTQPVTSSITKPGSDAALDSTSSNLSKNDNAREAQSETGTGGLFENQQPAEIDADTVAATGVTMKQFVDFLATERRRR